MIAADRAPVTAPLPAPPTSSSPARNTLLNGKQGKGGTHGILGGSVVADVVVGRLIVVVVRRRRSAIAEQSGDRYR